jgi:hypothetical protein
MCLVSSNRLFVKGAIAGIAVSFHVAAKVMLRANRIRADRGRGPRSMGDQSRWKTARVRGENY